MVDWRLAEQIARTVAGQPHDPLAIAADLAALSDDSERLVSGYTGLAAAGPLPRAERLGRREWIAANVASLRPVLDPVVSGLGGGLGPLGGPLRSGAGVVLGAEVGLLLGAMAQRVLGQYDLVLLDADAPTRLLYVEPNLGEAARSFAADPDEFAHWVALHEVTHALQFGAVPWLRGHLAGLLRELLGSLEVRVDASGLARLPGRDDLRALAGAVRSGDVMSLVAGQGRTELMASLQATMVVVEGYAEHVMDVVGAEVLPSLAELRAALERRRASQPALARLLTRLMGLDLKLRQYEQGKRFCDAVAAEGGISALNRVWAGPEALPTLAELDDPRAWADRTRVPSVTSP